MSLWPRLPLTLALISTSLVLTTGCAVGNFSGTAPTAASVISVKGNVHGGQQAVSGATIQLYAASANAIAGASTALISTPVITDSSGNFRLTGLYTCPTSDALIYIVGTGGNPGLAGNVNNSGIAMMSLLGRCSDALAAGDSLYSYVDELTTVVAVQALAPFMTDYAHIGSAPNSTSGIGAAYETATDEIDFTSGQFDGQPTIELPETTLNTLADIIGACINSPGGSGACSTLFSKTGGAADTIGAALYMTKNPASNTTTLYNLIPAAPPYQPYYNAVPSDFSAAVGYALPAFVQGGTLDSNGHLWLYFGGYNYNPGTDTSTDTPGYIAVYDGNFNQLFTVQPGTGGLYYPDEFSRDANGNVFAINANNTISEFNSNGGAVSPPAGWPTGLSSTFTPSGSGNGYINNGNQGGPIIVDALGTIWGGEGYGNTTGDCYFQMTAGTGAVVTPATETYCAATMMTDVSTAAVDGQGNAWASGYNSIAKVNSLGVLTATAPTSQGCFYPDSIATGSLGSESATENILYDRVNNQLWGYSEAGAGVITDAGLSVFCNFGSTTMPVLPYSASTSSTAGAPFTGGSILIGPDSAALDGAGNFWFVTGGATASGVVASDKNYFTGTVTYSSFLAKLTPSGVLTTPYSPGSGTYGLQPSGFGTNGTASVTNTRFSVSGPSVSILGIDNAGNIWAVDDTALRIIKITGLATANSVNY